MLCSHLVGLIVHGQARLEEEKKARVLAEASIIHSLVHDFSGLSALNPILIIPSVVARRS